MIEDEDVVVQGTQAMLEMLGYRVIYGSQDWKLRKLFTLFDRRYGHPRIMAA